MAEPFFTVDTREFRSLLDRFAVWIGLARNPEPILRHVGRYLVESNKQGILDGRDVDGSPFSYLRPASEGWRRIALAEGLTHWIAGGTAVTVGWKDQNLIRIASYLTTGYPTVYPRVARALAIPTAEGVIFRKSARGVQPHQLIGLREYGNASERIRSITRAVILGELR